MADKIQNKRSVDKDMFIEQYCTNGHNGVQAVIAAGFSGTYKAARVSAHRLLTNANMREAIAKRKAEIAETIKEKTELTVEKIADRFADIAERAKNQGDLVNENRAIENLAKSRIVRFFADDDASTRDKSIIGILAIVGRNQQPNSKVINSTPAILTGEQLPENMDYQSDNADLTDEAGQDDTNESQKED